MLAEKPWNRAELAEVAAGGVQPYHQMPNRPVVAVVDVEPLEQGLVALEEFLQRIQEQALAEPPRARQEVARTLVEQPLDVGGLVHVVAVPLAQLARRLHADGHPEPLHRVIL